MTPITPVIFILTLLQIADGVTTYIGLNSTHAEEANPVINNIIEYIGVIASVGITKAIVLFFIYQAFLQRDSIQSNPIAFLVVIMLTLFSLFVVVNNLIVLL